MGELVIVAQPEDPVAVGVQQVVASAGGSVVWYQPRELAALNIDLTEQTFDVEERIVRTVLWRVSPEMPLAEDFQIDDRAFAGAEVAAAWIAALNTNGTVAINRFDAEAWYSGLRPQYWRDRLKAAGVAVTTISVGDCDVPDDWRWSPYTTGELCETPERRSRAVMATACHPPTSVVTSIAVCGRTLDPSPAPNIDRAAELLDEWGVGLAAMDVDPAGHLHGVRVLPVFDDVALLARVTTAIGNRLYDSCIARRS